jgi:hypothetical protein
MLDARCSTMKMGFSTIDHRSIGDSLTREPACSRPIYR